jgi:hypothetical protein
MDVEKNITFVSVFLTLHSSQICDVIGSSHHHLPILEEYREKSAS